MPDEKEKQIQQNIHTYERKISSRNDRSPESTNQKASLFQEKFIMAKKKKYRDIFHYLNFEMRKSFRYPDIRKSL